jgi:hypothetical protein
MHNMPSGHDGHLGHLGNQTDDMPSGHPDTLLGYWPDDMLAVIRIHSDPLAFLDISDIPAFSAILVTLASSATLTPSTLNP